MEKHIVSTVAVVAIGILDLVACSIIFFLKKAYQHSDSLKDSVKELHTYSFNIFIYWILLFMLLRIIIRIIDPPATSLLGECYLWADQRHYMLGFLISSMRSFYKEIQWARQQHNSKTMRNTIEAILLIVGMCLYVLFFHHRT